MLFSVYECKDSLKCEYFWHGLFDQKEINYITAVPNAFIVIKEKDIKEFENNKIIIREWK